MDCCYYYAYGLVLVGIILCMCTCMENAEKIPKGYLLAIQINYVLKYIVMATDTKC